MAKKLYWLKRTNILEDPKMMYLISRGPRNYIIWHLLQDVAANINDDGKIYVSPTKPMDTAFLAKCIGQSKRNVEKCLAILEELDLLSLDDRGILRIMTWETLQDFKKMQTIREQTKQRVAAYRQRKANAQVRDTPVDVVTEPAASTTETEVGETAPDIEAVNRYQARWGQVNGVLAEKLCQLAEDWGDEAVCQAIDIAYEKGSHHLNYIRAVLVNSNGQPERKESIYERREKELDQVFDQVFSEGQQTDQCGESETHVRKFAVYDGGASARTQGSLAPAMQI